MRTICALMEKLSKLIPAKPEKPKRPDYVLMRSFLGGSFISPESEALEAAGIRYPRRMLSRLKRSVPETFRIMSRLDCRLLLLPGPPETLSVSNLSDRFAQGLVSQSVRDLKNGIFFSNDFVMPGWYLVECGPLKASEGKTIEEQSAMVEENWRFPCVAEAIWIAHLFRLVGNRIPYAGYAVRTRSVDHAHGRILVSATDDRVSVSAMPDRDKGASSIMPLFHCGFGQDPV